MGDRSDCDLSNVVAAVATETVGIGEGLERGRTGGCICRCMGGNGDSFNSGWAGSVVLLLCVSRMMTDEREKRERLSWKCGVEQLGATCVAAISFG